ncbi:aminotransferase class V-fold PLP-dependent enzyme [Corynebacterium sp. CNCTC7651]|uniref:aminotransferase class V-fold PLP-dependent enzyme n=1 Tax=Corynebacterium sp. CNCTC7651 TaxID=2815361 RepID=UPI001F15AE7C|nr:aminotransferase class V-fold PLP-dependent enzyme [Corynebacterium sp. CNCTC7651]
MSYDVAGVRGLYTSLSDGWIYLNAHDTPQIPERVSSAVARSFRMSAAVPPPEPSRGTHVREAVGRPEGEAFLADARAAVADLAGVSPERVVLGPSLPALYMALTAAMRPLYRHNSSIVLNNVDRPALNTVLTRANAEVRWAQADLATGELPAWQYDGLVDGSTRLVSIPAAHAQLGTVVAVRDIVDRVQGRSRAWVLVDASSYAPYRLITFDDWRADIVALDVAELGGPRVAALVFRDEAMLRRLDAELLAAPQLTVSEGLAGGVSAAVDHYASLAGVGAGAGGGAVGASGVAGANGSPRQSRRARLAISMNEMSVYMESLREDLETFLGTLPVVHIVGITGEAAEHADADRIPRLTFGVRGVPSATVLQRLVANGMVATEASASTLLQDMGVFEMGGAVTVGLAPFNTQADIVQLTRTVASLA